MEWSFYGAVTGLASLGYLSLAWAHRTGAAVGRLNLSSRSGQAVLLFVLALHGASLLPNWFSRDGLQFGFAVSISWTLWLAVLLFTSLLSTTIMELNGPILQKMVSLAFFIPMVVGTCGNAGTQSATMMVRAMALGDVRPEDFFRVMRRELVMGLALGVALGFMAYFRVMIQDHTAKVAWIVGVAMLATLLASNLSGALMPLILKRLHLDPALTAGPFIATISDAVGITIYFQIALWFLKFS